MSGKPFDLERFGQRMADHVKAYVSQRVEPLEARIAQLEAENRELLNQLAEIDGLARRAPVEMNGEQDDPRRGLSES